MDPQKISKVYGSVLVLTLVALFVIKVLNISYPLTVQTSAVSGELAVVGEGKVDAIPDTAIADVGITVADLPTVEAVQKQINTTDNEIISAVSKLGVKKTNVKTSNYSVYFSVPDYNGILNLGGKAEVIECLGLEDRIRDSTDIRIDYELLLKKADKLERKSNQLLTRMCRNRIKLVE